MGQKPLDGVVFVHGGLPGVVVDLGEEGELDIPAAGSDGVSHVDALGDRHGTVVHAVEGPDLHGLMPL